MTALQPGHFTWSCHLEDWHFAMARTGRQLYFAGAKQEHTSRILAFHEEGCFMHPDQPCASGSIHEIDSAQVHLHGAAA